MDTLTAATGGEQRWAAGGGERQAVDCSPGTTYSTTEAAQLLGVPVRTLRDWISSGILPAIEPLPPARGRRITAEALEMLRRRQAASGGTAAATGGDGRQAAPAGGEERRWAAADVDSSPLNGASHGLSPGAAGESRHADFRAAADGGTSRHAEHRADLAEQKAEQLQQQVSSQMTEISFLRSQLDRRAQEIEQHATAEQQLRVMLLRLEETNRELAGALVMKALPPAPEPDTQTPTPKRARWWALWRR